MANAIEVVGLIIAVGILFPIAFDFIFNANTTGWDANTITVFENIPVIAVVAILLGILVAYLVRGKK